jgi:hypothetical protein
MSMTRAQAKTASRNECGAFISRRRRFSTGRWKEFAN